MGVIIKPSTIDNSSTINFQNKYFYDSITPYSNTINVYLDDVKTDIEWIINPKIILSGNDQLSYNESDCTFSGNIKHSKITIYDTIKNFCDNSKFELKNNELEELGNLVTYHTSEDGEEVTLSPKDQQEINHAYDNFTKNHVVFIKFLKSFADEIKQTKIKFIFDDVVKSKNFIGHISMLSESVYSNIMMPTYKNMKAKYDICKGLIFSLSKFFSHARNTSYNYSLNLNKSTIAVIRVEAGCRIEDLKFHTLISKHKTAYRTDNFYIHLKNVELSKIYGEFSSREAVIFLENVKVRGNIVSFMGGQENKCIVIAKNTNFNGQAYSNEIGPKTLILIDDVSINSLPKVNLSKYPVIEDFKKDLTLEWFRDTDWSDKNSPTLRATVKEWIKRYYNSSIYKDKRLLFINQDVDIFKGYQYIGDYDTQDINVDLIAKIAGYLIK